MQAGYVAGFSYCDITVPAFSVGREELQGSSLAGSPADGMRYIDEGTGRIHIPLSVHRYLSAVAWADVWKDVLFSVGRRTIVSHTFGCLVLGSLSAGRRGVR